VANPTFTFQVENLGRGAGWTSLGTDVMATPPPRWSRGFTRNNPLDLVAPPTQMSCTLNNSSLNSAKRLGYYSPDNASARLPGFAVGIRIRVQATYLATTYTLWIGWIDSITPVAGKYGDRVTHVHASGWFMWAAKFQILGLSTLTNVTSDVVAAAIVNAVPITPAATTYDTGSETWPYALDTVRQENSNALSELQRVAQSEFCKIYEEADGTVHVESRHSRRYGSGAIVSLGEADIVNLEIQYPLQVVNQCKVISYPRAVGSAGETLFTLTGTPPAISAGTTQTFVCNYVDPNQISARLGALTVIVPTSSNGDFAFNTASDGSGTDITSSFSLASTASGTMYGSDSSKLVFVNNHPTATGYPTTLRVRGTPLRAFQPVTSIYTSTSSVDNYGNGIISFDSKYQADLVVSQAICNWIVNLWKAPVASLKVTFLCNGSQNTQDLWLAALTTEIGDACIITESILSNTTVARYVDGIEMTLEEGQFLRVSWYLSYGDLGIYWRLDDASFQLGLNTELAAV